MKKTYRSSFVCLQCCCSVSVHCPLPAALFSERLYYYGTVGR